RSPRPGLPARGRPFPGPRPPASRRLIPILRSTRERCMSRAVPTKVAARAALITLALLLAAACGQKSTPKDSSAAPAGADQGGSGAPASSTPATRAADRTGVTDTKIRIGIHAPITGAAPFPQNAFDKGKDVYWKFLAEKGGIFGRNVEIVFRDDQFNPSRAVQVCREMVEQEHVFILMGAAGSEQITACARYANSMGVPYLSAGVNEEGLTGLASDWASSQTDAQPNPVLVSY